MPYSYEGKHTDMTAPESVRQVRPSTHFSAERSAARIQATGPTIALVSPRGAGIVEGKVELAASDPRGQDFRPHLKTRMSTRVT